MDDKTKPITKAEEVASNPDPNIDKDLPGFPAGTANEENISPKTEEEKDAAGVNDETSPAP